MPQKINRWTSLWLVFRITLGFLILAPILTLFLLKLKDYPSFPGADWSNALPWIYRVLTFPSFLSGITLGLGLAFLTRRTRYFHEPYDIGRAISLGAIGGSLTQAAAIVLQHVLQTGQGRPHLFWLATAAIAGCLCGALSASIALRRLTHVKPWEQQPKPLWSASLFVLGVFLGGAVLNYIVFAGSLVSPDPERRETAQQLAFHRSTRPGLLARAVTLYLRSSNPDVRMRAVQSLAILGQHQPSVISAIEKLRSDPEPDIQITATQVITYLQKRSSERI